MLPGDAPANLPRWRYRVAVNGEDITGKVSQWSVDTTLGEPVGSTPVRVQRGEGSGSLVLMAPREDGPVADGVVPDPWIDPDWPPHPGSVVTVEASSDDGVTWFPVGNMLADKPWDNSDGTAGASLVDRADRFSRPFNLDPLLRIMPPSPGLLNTREIGLHHCWLIDAAAAAAGWNSTLPVLGDSTHLLLRASMQGSTWPQRGQLFIGARDSSLSSIEAGFQPCEWGMCASGVQAAWKLGVTPDGTTRLAANSADWQCTFMVGSGHSKLAQISLERMDGSGANASIQIYDDRSVAVWHDGVNVVQLSAAQVGTIVGVRREGAAWTLWSTLDDGTLTTLTGSSSITAVYDMCRFIGTPGCRVGAIDITARLAGVTPDAITPTTWEPTCVFGTSWSANETFTVLSASTAVVDSTVGEVLDNVTKAALASYSPDESGRLIVQSWAGATEGAGTRRTLTSTNDLLGLVKRSWSLVDLASQIQVTYQEPTWNVSPDYAVTVWQGPGGDTLAAGATEETFAQTDGDTDWIQVDTRFTICDKYTIASRSGHGSFCGGSIVTGQDANHNDIITSAEAGDYTAIIERVTAQTIKITETATGTHGVIRQTPESVTYPAGWRRRALPLLRAGALNVWTKNQQTQDIPDVSPDAQTFTWDVGRWGNSAVGVPRILSTMVRFMGDPALMLEQVSIQPDPRIQVGDLHYLKAPRLGLDLDVVVAGKHMSAGAGGQGLTMTLDLVVVGHNGGPVSYHVWQAMASGRTYAGFEDQARLHDWTYSMLEQFPTIIN